MMLLRRYAIVGGFSALTGACQQAEMRGRSVGSAGAEAERTRRLATAGYLGTSNPSLAHFDLPRAEPRDVAAIFVSPSCSYSWTFMQDDLPSMTSAFDRRGIVAALVPYPRHPNDLEVLVALLCAGPQAGFGTRYAVHSTWAASQRTMPAAAEMLAAARSTGGGAACSGDQAVRAFRANRVFGDRIAGITQTPTLVLGGRIYEDLPGIARAQRDMAA